MDDGLGPRDTWDELDDSDEPTQPLPVIRPGNRTPAGAPRAEMPPLPPAEPRWPPHEPGDGAAPHHVWTGDGTSRFAGLERMLQAARERQLSLGCGTLAAIVLLGALVLAALGGNFAGLNAPFVPRPPIQAAPRPSATPLSTPTATPRPTPTPSPLPTATPAPSPTPSPLPTATPAPSPTAVPSPTPQPLPTAAPSPTPLPIPTQTTIPPAASSPSAVPRSTATPTGA